MSSGLKKKGLEWDLNDWRWDSNLFLATPSNASPSKCSRRELGRAEGEIDFGVVDKRRRVSPEDDDGEECINAATTNGDDGQISGQRGRSSEDEMPRQGACSSSGPCCQVDGCTVNLSSARDYNKRHKVCEVHTKSGVVRIKNVEHRFCQQCSRLVGDLLVKLTSWSCYMYLCAFFSLVHLCLWHSPIISTSKCLQLGFFSD